MWRRFLWPFALTFAVGLAIPFALVLLADPYGVSPARLVSSEHVIPTQRRFIVADIIRSGRYESFIVGTSTVNSINPAWLESAFGGRFANVAVHGATPYEQMRVLDLVLRQKPAPRMIILGLDDTWCSRVQPARYHPQVQFPEWLFEDSRLGHLTHLLNWHAVELARRKLEIAVGYSKTRVAANGFYDDLPPRLDMVLRKGHAPAGRWCEAGSGELGSGNRRTGVLSRSVSSGRDAEPERREHAHTGRLHADLPAAGGEPSGARCVQVRHCRCSSQTPWCRPRLHAADGLDDECQQLLGPCAFSPGYRRGFTQPHARRAGQPCIFRWHLSKVGLVGKKGLTIQARRIKKVLAKPGQSDGVPVEIKIGDLVGSVRGRFTKSTSGG